jgi:uncharacterized protein
MESRHHRVIENEGQKIFGMLHLPKGEGPFPCVVVHHGFAGNKVGTRRIYVQMAEALSQLGIATFRFDFRGCGDSEGGFGDVTLDTKVSDSLVALSHLSDDPAIDASRMGYLGASLGGSIAVMAAHRGALIRSLALWAPVARGQFWHEDYQSTQPESAIPGYLHSGGEGASTQFCEQFISLQADQMLSELGDLPLFHAHGELDDVVFPRHADAFATVRPEGRFLRLPNSDHSFSHDPDRQILVRETAGWFQRTLV